MIRPFYPLSCQVILQTVKSMGSVFERFHDSLPSLGEDSPTLTHSRSSSRDLAQMTSAADVWLDGCDPHQLQVRTLLESAEVLNGALVMSATVGLLQHCLQQL